MGRKYDAIVIGAAQMGPSLKLELEVTEAAVAGPV
jgi:hypothetical protein